MKFKILIDHEFSFVAENSYNLGSTFDRSVITDKQGVYILHNGPLDNIWDCEDKIFYIGATDR